MSSAVGDSAVVHLTSSTLLQDSLPFNLFGAHRPPVSDWTLADVQQHVFLLVWVCGIPVHVRYVADLLQHSAVAHTFAGGASAATFIEMAQRDVLASVLERGRRVHATLATWPMAATSAFRSATSLSFLVPLGVEEVQRSASHEACHCAANATCAAHGEALPHQSCSAPTATAADASERTAVTVRTPHSDPASRYPPCEVAVQAVAVQPTPSFTNVTALALYAPAETEASPTAVPALPLPSVCSVPVDPLWCSRAYWTAVRQAQQWAEASSRATSTAIANKAGEASKLKAGAPLCSIAPTLVPVREQQRGKRARGVAETVIVDADDDEGDEEEARGTFIAPVRRAPSPKGTARLASAQDAVIVIDSDDE